MMGPPQEEGFVKELEMVKNSVTNTKHPHSK